MSASRDLTEEGIDEFYSASAIARFDLPAVQSYDYGAARISFTAARFCVRTEAVRMRTEVRLFTPHSGSAELCFDDTPVARFDFPSLHALMVRMAALFNAESLRARATPPQHCGG